MIESTNGTNQRMSTNMKNNKVDKDTVLFADECFQIFGICFYVQNKLGRFAREKQYADLLENRLKELGLKYEREFVVANSGNRIDYLLFDRILLEIKAKPFLTREDYAQVQRYLQILELDLGLLINFQSRSAQPYRILRQKNYVHS